MNPKPYDSLRRKLVLPFVALGFAVSSLLSLITFALVADLEERAIERTLRVQLESFRNRRQTNPDALPPSASLLHAHPLPSPQFPQLKTVPLRDDRITRLMAEQHEYSVLAARVGEEPFALLYDRSYVTSSLRKLALFLVLGTGLMTLLSFIIGNRLAGKVVKPIGKLLGDITAQSMVSGLDQASRPRLAAEDYPNDDIGRLVRAVEAFSLRLYGFVEREGYFAADVAHELRTPIAVIRGTAEVLVEYPALPEAVRQRLHTIQRQAVRMGQILEAMLLLAREEAEGSDPACAVAELVEDIAADSRLSLADGSIRLVCELDAHPILPVERSLVYVVVANLLRNACAHTREGTISLRLEADRLIIEDTGVGIPQERFSTLFQRHVKGEESVGYGLGLSIVARVTERLGWRVTIASEPGSGTKVSLLFHPDKFNRLDRPA